MRLRDRALSRVLISVVALGCLQVQAQDGGSSGAQVIRGATRSDWPSYGGTELAWRYSALNQINNRNVRELAPAWIFQTGESQSGLDSTPIVLDGVLYLVAQDDVFALDGSSGRLLWQYKHQPESGLAIRRSRGLAIHDGKVFMGTSDDHVVALDQKTGREIWRVATDDPSVCRCNISGAPLIVKNLLVIGMGAEGGHRGYLSAFDTRTGHMKWRFYTIPAPSEKGNDTWQGESWKYGGANTWTTGSYDSELNLIYWSTGNPTPMLYGANREGSNLYSCSILALDADTGKLRWYYQEIPHDTWDFDSNWELVLVDRPIQGRMRKLLVHVSKGGYTYLLDRETGAFLGARPYAKHINWISDITATGELVGRRDPAEGQSTFVCPSVYGAKTWSQVAYSPRTGWIYAPVIEMCNDLALFEHVKASDSYGGSFTMRPPPGHDTSYSHLDAFDPVTGHRQWTYSYPYHLLASVLATAGDLVFSADPEGHFFALDARSGRKLWSFQTGAGSHGGSVTYMCRGRQYIAAPTGGSMGLDSNLRPEAETWRVSSTLVVFALPERSQ